MHIIHLAPYYAPAYAFGGVARACEGMARALTRRGHTVTILTTDALNQSERYTGPLQTVSNGVHVRRARNTSVWLRGRANLSTPLGLQHLAAEALPGADILHIHEFRTIENLLVTPHAVRFNVPIFLSPHGTLTHSTGRSTLKQVWDALLSPHIARRINTVIGLTDHEREEAAALWRQFGAQSRFAAVPNGVDPTAFDTLPHPTPFRERWGLGTQRVILYMGRLHPRKGADKLLRAFLTLNPPDTSLVIAGPDEGLLPRLHALAADDPRVVFTGYLDGDARLAALAAADFFVLAAVGEGLPMTVLEAMAAGVPVIVSEGCHLPEVDTAGAGWVIAAQPEAIAAALHDALARDSASLAAMAGAARTIITERFTWDAVAAQLETIYLGA